MSLGVSRSIWRRNFNYSAWVWLLRVPFQGKPGLGTIQRLHLTLFVAAQHQCVAATGWTCVVSSTNRATSTFTDGALRGKSRSIPASRDYAYRSRQCKACTRTTPNCSAMSLSCIPSSVGNAMHRPHACAPGANQLRQLDALFLVQHNHRGNSHSLFAAAHYSSGDTRPG